MAIEIVDLSIENGGSFHSYLAGGWPTPLKNMSSSVGMMTFPYEMDSKNHVPNHQPVMQQFPRPDSSWISGGLRVSSQSLGSILLKIRPKNAIRQFGP